MTLANLLRGQRPLLQAAMALWRAVALMAALQAATAAKTPPPQPPPSPKMPVPKPMDVLTFLGNANQLMSETARYNKLLWWVHDTNITDYNTDIAAASDLVYQATSHNLIILFCIF